MDALAEATRAFGRTKAGRYAFTVKEIEKLSKHLEKTGGYVTGIKELCHESGEVKATIIISFETDVLDEYIAQSRQQGQRNDE